MVVAASAGTDVPHHMALADLGSGFLAAGETAALSLFAACVAFGQAAVLGVQVLKGTAPPAAAAVAVVAVDGIHAGHCVVLADLGKPQAAAALPGIPVAENAPDRTAETASDANWRHELDKAGGVVGPGHVVLGIHAGVLGCAVLSLVVAVFVDEKKAEKLVSDCFVVYTVDNLAVAVAAVIVAVHGKETAAAAAAVVAVSGDLEPADFP